MIEFDQVRVCQVLQERNTANISACKEYLYYLMTGLEALPCYSPGAAGNNAFLWRGVSRLSEIVKN